MSSSECALTYVSLPSATQLLNDVDKLAYVSRIDTAARIGRDHFNNPTQLHKLINDLRNVTQPPTPVFMDEATGDDFTSVFEPQWRETGQCYHAELIALMIATSAMRTSKKNNHGNTDSYTEWVTMLLNEWKSPSRFFTRLSASGVALSLENSNEDILRHHEIFSAAPAKRSALLRALIKQRRTSVLAYVLPALANIEGAAAVASVLHGANSETVRNLLYNDFDTIDIPHGKVALTDRRLNWSALSRHHGLLIVSLISEQLERLGDAESPSLICLKIAQAHKMDSTPALVRKTYQLAVHNVWNLWSKCKSWLCNSLDFRVALWSLIERFPDLYVGDEETYERPVFPNLFWCSDRAFLCSVSREGRILSNRILDFIKARIERISTEQYCIVRGHIFNSSIVRILKLLIRYNCITRAIGLMESIFLLSTPKTRDVRSLDVEVLESMKGWPIVSCRDGGLRITTYIASILKRFLNESLAHQNVIDDSILSINVAYGLYENIMSESYRRVQIAESRVLTGVDDTHFLLAFKRFEHHSLDDPDVASVIARHQRISLITVELILPIVWGFKGTLFNGRDSPNLCIRILEQSMKALVLAPAAMITVWRYLLPSLKQGCDFVLTKQEMKCVHHLLVLTLKTCQLLTGTIYAPVPKLHSYMPATLLEEASTAQAYVVALTMPHILAFERFYARSDRGNDLQKSDENISIDQSDDVIWSYEGLKRLNAIAETLPPESKIRHSVCALCSFNSIAMNGRLYDIKDYRHPFNHIVKLFSKAQLFEVAGAMLDPQQEHANQQMRDAALLFSDIRISHIRETLFNACKSSSVTKRKECLCDLVKCTYIVRDVDAAIRTLTFCRNRIRNERLEVRLAVIQCLQDTFEINMQKGFVMVIGVPVLTRCNVWLEMLDDAMASSEIGDLSKGLSYTVLCVFKKLAEYCIQVALGKLDEELFNFGEELSWRIAVYQMGEARASRRYTICSAETFIVPVPPYNVVDDDFAVLELCDSRGRSGRPRLSPEHAREIVNMVAGAYKKRLDLGSENFLLPIAALEALADVVHGSLCYCDVLLDDFTVHISDVVKYSAKDTNGFALLNRDDEKITVDAVVRVMKKHYRSIWCHVPKFDCIVDMLLRTWIAPEIALGILIPATKFIHKHRMKRPERFQARLSLTKRLLKSTISSAHLKYVWTFMLRSRQDLLDMVLTPRGGLRGVYFILPQHRRRLHARVYPRQFFNQKYEHYAMEDAAFSHWLTNNEENSNFSDASVTKYEVERFERLLEDVELNDEWIPTGYLYLHRLLPRQTSIIAERWRSLTFSSDISLEDRQLSARRLTLMPCMGYSDIVSIFDLDSPCLDDVHSNIGVPISVIKIAIRGLSVTDEPAAALNLFLSSRFLKHDAKTVVYALSGMIQHLSGDKLSLLLMSLVKQCAESIKTISVFKEVLRLLVYFSKNVSLVLDLWDIPNLHPDIKTAILKFSITHLLGSSELSQKVAWRIIDMAVSSSIEESIFLLLVAKPEASSSLPRETSFRNKKMASSLSDLSCTVPILHHRAYSQLVLDISSKLLLDDSVDNDVITLTLYALSSWAVIGDAMPVAAKMLRDRLLYDLSNYDESECTSEGYLSLWKSRWIERFKILLRCCGILRETVTLRVYGNVEYVAETVDALCTQFSVNSVNPQFSTGRKLIFDTILKVVMILIAACEYRSPLLFEITQDVMTSLSTANMLTAFPDLVVNLKYSLYSIYDIHNISENVSRTMEMLEDAINIYSSSSTDHEMVLKFIDTKVLKPLRTCHKNELYALSDALLKNLVWRHVSFEITTSSTNDWLDEQYRVLLIKHLCFKLPVTCKVFESTYIFIEHLMRNFIACGTMSLSLLDSKHLFELISLFSNRNPIESNRKISLFEPQEDELDVNREKFICGVVSICLNTLADLDIRRNDVLRTDIINILSHMLSKSLLLSTLRAIGRTSLLGRLLHVILSCETFLKGLSGISSIVALCLPLEGTEAYTFALTSSEEISDAIANDLAPITRIVAAISSLDVRNMNAILHLPSNISDMHAEVGHVDNVGLSASYVDKSMTITLTLLQKYPFLFRTLPNIYRILRSILIWSCCAPAHDERAFEDVAYIISSILIRSLLVMPEQEGVNIVTALLQGSLGGTDDCGLGEYLLPGWIASKDLRSITRTIAVNIISSIGKPATNAKTNKSKFWRASFEPIIQSLFTSEALQDPSIDASTFIHTMKLQPKGL